MTEPKKRVPLAYVGYWNTRNTFDRMHKSTGRVNAVQIEGHAPHTLLLSCMTVDRIDHDMCRVVVQWHPGDGSTGFDIIEPATAEVIKHIPNEVLYGGTVDVSDWGLQPLYEENPA